MPNNKRFCMSVLTLLCLTFVQSAVCRPVSAAPGDGVSRGQAVMVIVDQITWDDYVKGPMPVLHKLAGQGVVGLMTTNTAAGQLRTPDNTYAAIGAGARIGGGPEGGLALNAAESYRADPASDEFFRRTGRRASDNEVVHLGIVGMEKYNLRLHYDFSPGALGTVLHQNGLKTAVLGNADLASRDGMKYSYNRQAAAIAMDAAGRVDFGDVSARTGRPDPGSLAGLSADFAYLLQQFADLRNKADFIVIETGDTSRLNSMRFIASDSAWQDRKQDILASVDGFVGELWKSINLNHDLLMVVVPGPPGSAMAEGRFLTPFVMAGPGIAPGMAWSGTIKRPGLADNSDIAVTVLNHFGVAAAVKGKQGKREIRLGGQVIKSQASANPFEEITKIEQDAVFSHNVRYPLVKGYISIGLVIVAVAAAALLLRHKKARYLLPVLAGYSSIPGIFLWARYFSHFSMAALVLEILAICAVAVLPAFLLGRAAPLAPYLATTGVTAMMVLLDILAGAPLAKTSPFSYDVMGGARYYGLGNEYMGVVIGCLIVFAGLFLDMLKTAGRAVRALMVTVFAGAVYVIAAPGFGANAGGTAAAVAGLGTAVFLLYGGSINKKTVLAICGCIVVTLAGFIIYEMTRPVEIQSHIGRTVSLVRENGFSEIINIISRKWKVNFRLILSTSWSWFYFLSLSVILLINRILPGPAAGFRSRYPWFNRMLAAVTAGSVFALVFNDSGVVAAATMIIFAIMPYLAGIIMSEE